ncbi:MAG: LAGLIDADG family homing endonuclease [Candidatus Omnitrophota bacterium]
MKRASGDETKYSLLFKNKHFWYLVGLVTADGSLSKDKRHIDITSKDKKYLEDLKTCFNLDNRVAMKNKNKKNVAYRIQLGSKLLWNFLYCIGLMPRKTHELMSVNVPATKFRDFLRGFIDGDGNIQSWINNRNGHRQWSLRMKILSGAFAKWLCKATEYYVGAKGRLHLESKENRQDIYVLKFGKLSARHILKRCYYKGAFAYYRKRSLALQCLSSETGWSTHSSVLTKAPGCWNWHTVQT